MSEYLEHSQAFRDVKNGFFSTNYNIKNKQDTFDTIKNAAGNTDYNTLLKSQKSKLIESEFNTLFAALKKQNKENQEQFWLWCYYCACMLEAFYSKKGYKHPKQKAQYKAYKKQIEDIITKKKSEIVKDESFLEAMWVKLKNFFIDLASAPLHLSSSRDYVSMANIYRIYWVFSRLTIFQGLGLADSLKWLEQLDAFLGTKTDVKSITGTLHHPILALIFNILSVAFFLIRLILIDTVLLIKHTFFPEEFESHTTRWQRFQNEIYKRHCRIINDIVWPVINFITNFNQITHISDPVCLYITAGFLFFDFLMNFYQLYWAGVEFDIKQAQFNKEIAENENNNQLMHANILRAQLRELEISWDVQKSGFYFQAAAALLLAIGFTGSILLASPVLVLCSYFVCVIGVAMYLSGKAYSQYREKAEQLNRHTELDLTVPSQASIEFEMARREFIFTMTKNIVVPIVLITVFAVYWPAAIVLTAVYLGVEGILAYKQHKDAEEIKRLEQQKEDHLGFEEINEEESVGLEHSL